MSSMRTKRRDGLVTITQASSFLGVQQSRLTEWLRLKGWLLPPSAVGNVPHAEKIAAGLMDQDEFVVKRSNGEQERRFTPLITRQGYRALRDMLTPDELSALSVRRRERRS